MQIARSKLAFLLLLAGLGSAEAVTPDNFTNGAHDSSWSNSLNWSNGLPGSLTAVTVATQPSSNILGVDTGVANNAITSFSFGSSLTGALQVLPAGAEQLQISSSISNASSFAQSFGLYVGLSGAVLQSGASGLTFAGGLGLTQATTNSNSGAITLGADVPFLLKLSATPATLSTAGALNYNSGDLVLNATQTFGNGTSLSLVSAASRSGHLASVAFSGSYTGNFTQVSTGVWTDTTGGQTWQFAEATGVLSNVPEPSAACCLVAGALMLGGRRRRGPGRRAARPATRRACKVTNRAVTPPRSPTRASSGLC